MGARACTYVAFVFVRLRPIRWRSHVCVLVLLFVSREGVRDGIYAERAALTAARHSLKGGTERDRMRDESGGRGDFCLASGARMRVKISSVGPCVHLVVCEKRPIYHSQGPATTPTALSLRHTTQKDSPALSSHKGPLSPKGGAARYT